MCQLKLEESAANSWHINKHLFNAISLAALRGNREIWQLLPPQSMQEFIGGAITEAEVRKYTPETIKGKKTNLSLFLCFFEDERGITEMEQVTPAVLRQAADVTRKDIQNIDGSWGEINFEVQPMNRMLMADTAPLEAAGS